MKSMRTNWKYYYYYYYYYYERKITSNAWQQWV